MKFLFSIFFLLSFCTISLGQSSFNMEAYLSTALGDQELEIFESQQDFLAENKYNSPWVSRVEVRIGSEDVNPSLNDYRLRLTATNPGEIKANKIYHQQQQDYLATKGRLGLSEALKNRYILILELHDRLVRYSSVEEQLKFNAELMGHIEATSNYDLDNVIGFHANQTDALLNLEDLKMQIAEIKYLIGLDEPGVKNTTNIQDFISIEQIRNYVANTKREENNQNLKVLQAQSKLQLSEQMLKIDRAESFSNMGYIQTNIDTERGNEVNDHIGFQVGIRIPIVNPDKPNLNRKKVELMEDEADVQITKTQVENRKKLNELRLSQLFSRYEIIQARIKLAKQINYGNISSLNWFTVAKLKNYQVKLTTEGLNVEKQIREEFIAFLDIKGLLVAQPLVNYLSASYKSIESK